MRTLRRRWYESWRPASAAQYAILVALVGLSFALVVLMVDLSLRPSVLIYADFWGLPWPPTLHNYHIAVLDLLGPMVRSLLVSLGSIAGILVVACPAAYAVSRMQFALRQAVLSVVVAAMAVPGVILLTPQFILAGDLHLRGSLAGLVLFYVAAGLPFAIFLISMFFRGQPHEIFEAARMDGASELRCLLHIAAPIAVPILVTVGIMNFIAVYGDFIWPSLMLPQSQQTLMLALQTYSPQVSDFVNQPDLGAQSAGYAFAALPQLILLVLGMKYYVQGAASGALKA